MEKKELSSNLINPMDFKIDDIIKENKSDDLISKLYEQISSLKRENLSLKTTLIEVGLSEDDIKMSEVEMICIEQINKLKDLSKDSTFTKDDAQVLEVLHRNLKIAKGENDFKKINKAKGLSTDELLKLVK